MLDQHSLFARACAAGSWTPAYTLEELKAEVIRLSEVQDALLSLPPEQATESHADDCDAACFEFDQACIILAMHVCGLG
jgi:hypothetical protein